MNLAHVALALSFAAPGHSAVGAFSSVGDVGTVSRSTQASYQDATGTYTVSASGDNIWGAQDAFGFVSKEARGDFIMGARVEIQTESAHVHRKAGIMFRQSLAADSPYVDVVVHGDGLTSLQYRWVAGGPTREVQCSMHAPSAVRLEKRGDFVSVSFENPNGGFEPAGCAIQSPLRGTFHAGLVVCAHDNAAVETALFKHVTFGKPPERAELPTYSIELLPLDSLDRRVIYHGTTRLEAASFTVSGDAICFRSDGQLHRLVLHSEDEPLPVTAENAADCEVAAGTGARGVQLPRPPAGDRVWLPRASAGKAIAYLVGPARGVDGRPAPADYRLMSIDGAEPRELARFHGDHGALGISPWSPDGKRLVFVSREPD